MAYLISQLVFRSDRIFILGPSHHFYLDGCALSQCDDYATPVGSLPLDKDSQSSLRTPHSVLHEGSV